MGDRVKFTRNLPTVPGYYLFLAQPEARPRIIEFFLLHNKTLFYKPLCDLCVQATHHGRHALDYGQWCAYSELKNFSRGTPTEPGYYLYIPHLEARPKITEFFRRHDNTLLFRPGPNARIFAYTKSLQESGYWLKFEVTE